MKTHTLISDRKLTRLGFEFTYSGICDNGDYYRCFLLRSGDFEIKATNEHDGETSEMVGQYINLNEVKIGGPQMTLARLKRIISDLGF